MASKYLNEPIGALELSNADDQTKGDKNVPLTVIVYAIDTRQVKIKERLVTALCGDGKPLSISIHEDDFIDEGWTSVEPGMVISFDCDVQGVSSSRIRVLPIGGPTRLDDMKFTFIHNELPDSDNDKCMLYGRVSEVVVRTKTNSPAKVLCTSGTGVQYIVQSFVGHTVAKLEALASGTMILIGPSRFKVEEFKDNLTYVVSCYTNTVIQDMGKPLHKDDEISNISNLEELRKKTTGKLVSLTVCLLRDVYEGTTSIIDVPGPVEPLDNSKKNRAILVGIAPTSNFKAGNVIELKAVVSPIDSMQLVYVSAKLTVEHKDKVFDMLPFSRYKLMVVSSGTKKKSSQSNSQSQSVSRTSSTGSNGSSQKPFAGNPLPPRKRLSMDGDDVFEDAGSSKKAYNPLPVKENSSNGMESEPEFSDDDEEKKS